MKEFLTEMRKIEGKFFEGGSTGKNLKYSITDFQNDNFRRVGEIMAVSITQDGPPPNFFMERIYNFISSGEINKDLLTKAGITDADLLDLIDKIETADTTALLELPERIAAYFLMMAPSPILNEVGSRTVNYLQDFNQSLEDEEEGSSSQESRVEDDGEQDKTNCTKGDAEQDKITVSSFMQWITGQEYVHITSAQRETLKIHVEFEDDCQLP